MQWLSQGADGVNVPLPPPESEKCIGKSSEKANVPPPKSGRIEKIKDKNRLKIRIFADNLKLSKFRRLRLPNPPFLILFL